MHSDHQTKGTQRLDRRGDSSLALVLSARHSAERSSRSTWILSGYMARAAPAFLFRDSYLAV